MNTFRSKKQSWAAGLIALLFAAPSLLFLHGCTDLDEEVFGSITPENFFRTEQEVLAAVAPVYAQLRTALGDYHNLSEVSTDEAVVPTRGSDWFDGGMWLETHRQTWTPNLGLLNGAWIGAYTGVARANTVLNNLESVDVAGKDVIVAELRALRAFYYYQLLDLFGGVPIVTEPAVDPDDPPSRNTRAEVFSFIEEELLAVRDVLPPQWPAASYGRMTQGAVDALLANLYLNAEVFTGTVTATGLQRGAPRWQDAVNAANRVLNAGFYRLPDDFFATFEVENQTSPENIFVVAHVAEDGLGMNFPMRTLHYNQLAPSPWNGFATLAETYAAFDTADVRRNIFLAGRAFNYNTGEPVNNRSGQPLFFTPEIRDITNASEGEGVRIVKWRVDTNNEGGNFGNDYALFRLAEMYLIKAEALNELNGPNQESIDLLNTLRRRAFEPDKPLQLSAFPTRESLRQAILQERLYELFYEAKRRQDLIRIAGPNGQPMFLQPWSFKERSEPYRILFPVPQPQIDANPRLQQNPGYGG